MADREPAPPLKRPSGPTADEVEMYLREHPEFLAERRDLVHLLVPPDSQRGDGVVDMQRYMLERVRGDLTKLQTQQNEILATSRSNLTTQNRIHAAVLRLLEARTLEELIEIIITDLAVQLDVDAAALGFEAIDKIAAGANRSALKILPRGAIDRFMGGGKDIVLLPDAAGDPALFGGAATLVRSQALLRLKFKREAPLGILACGSRTAGKFHPSQGTELLSFLGKAVELTIQGWLDRG